MPDIEKPGGDLSNKEVEQEIKVTKNPEQKNHPYVGSQDTGDKKVSGFGSETQQNDGWSPSDNDKEGKQ